MTKKVQNDEKDTKLLLMKRILFYKELSFDNENQCDVIELYPDPPARLSEEELLFSKQKLQKLKIFARLEIVSLQKRHY